MIRDHEVRGIRVPRRAKKAAIKAYDGRGLTGRERRRLQQMRHWIARTYVRLQGG